MITGPRTPEELESMLEDAVILEDSVAVEALFESGASVPELVGESVVTRPVRIFQQRGLALVIGHGVKVLRRAADGTWRCAITDHRRHPR